MDDVESRLTKIETRCEIVSVDIQDRLKRIEDKLDHSSNKNTLRWVIGLVVTTMVLNLTTIGIVAQMLR